MRGRRQDIDGGSRGERRTTAMRWVIGRTQAIAWTTTGNRVTSKKVPENMNIGVTQKVKK